MTTIAELTRVCRCCEGVHAVTPEPLANAPGLQALAYRVGTWATFKETLEAALSGEPALRDLTTRDDDDASIALLDAWATVLDVLTFYQERIANEGFLRTATEQRSVLELARAIGYELGPGAAAGAHLAFQLESAPGSPPSVQIRVGVPVQSVPGQDELPQTFETVEEIDARPEWNAVPARLTQPVVPALGAQELFLKGVATNLRPGDLVLFVGEEFARDATSERWDVRSLLTVERDPGGASTRVTWADGLGWEVGSHLIEPAQENLKIYALRQRAALFGASAPDWNAMPQSVRDGYPGGDGKNWPGLSISKVGAGTGTNAANTIFLDALYPRIVAGSYVVLVAPDSAAPRRGFRELFRVAAAADDSRTDFTLTAKTTRLELEGENLSRFEHKLRETTVFGESEQLELVETPLLDPVQGSQIDLAAPVPALPAGRAVAVTGRRARVAVQRGVTGLALVPDAGGASVPLHPGDELDVASPFVQHPDGTRTWRLVTLKGVAGTVASAPAAAFGVVAAPDTADVLVETAVVAESREGALVLASSLANAYDRASVRLAANVAWSTHGQTKAETLGSGDAARAFQRFTLKDSPLTYVPSAEPSGRTTTLAVSVNGVRWHEARSLYGLTPHDRSYVVRIGAAGKASVEFGDGASGTRLPTGQENVSARYRVGTGLVGQVAAGRLSLLLAPPLGVKAVTNPLAAAGAADPETLDRARQNAPLTVLTFDRIVSLQDVEDFAAAFAGVGKAQAAWLWDGETRFVELTVAADDGTPLGSGVAFDNLVRAIHASGDPRLKVRVEGHEDVRFRVSANVFVRADYDADAVLAAVTAALRAAFSFEARAFAQPVAHSEVESVAQRVEGVEAVALLAFHLVGATPSVEAVLPALGARRDATGIHPAQLLTLAPHGPDLHSS